MDLGEYLAAARTKPWEWRVHDCTAFPAIWAGLTDALPSYADEAEAEAMLHEAGGLVPLWERAATGRADEVALPELKPGDVGVIELMGVDARAVECGAIWTGRRWAFVPASGGIAAVSAPTVLKAWRPRCLRP
ncbi:MAG: hypothetical protein VX569_11050 [Pseudomonadota bacterium]|nr:hypothetical protein [Pseudomonadota bacterium]